MRPPSENGERILAGESSDELVYQLRHGRATRWVSTRAQTVERRDRRAVKVAGYSQDVTARRRAEELLRRPPLAGPL